MLGVFKKLFKINCKTGGKIATSFVELLIILAIVGILFVLYQKTIDRDAITTKYAYKNVINDMIAYAATETSQQDFGDSNICASMFNSMNTLGDMYCGRSAIPVLSNLTTTSGMRFFGLESDFILPSDVGTKFVMIDVDLDGLSGENRMGKDIYSLEILQDGHIRPAGAAVLDSSGNQFSLDGNIARDPKLYTVKAAYKSADGEYQTLGNKLSYAEAQCLSGNIFPYRASSFPYNIQMCIEDTTVRNAINAVRTASATDNIAELTQARDEAIKNYRKAQAIENTICTTLYSDDNSVAKGLAKANADVEARCKLCYKVVYKAKYCNGVVEATADCPEAVLEETGSCMTPEWAEISE